MDTPKPIQSEKPYCPILFILLTVSVTAAAADDVTVEIQTFPDYSDLVFTGQNVTLRCTASGAGDTVGLSVYFNETRIYGTMDSVVEDSRDGRLTFQTSQFFTHILIMHVRISDAGIYTCQARTQSGNFTDRFQLNVASESPQCISKCTSGKFDYLCYQRNEPSSFMRWENSADGVTFEVFTEFSVHYHGTSRRVGVSDISRIEHDHVNYTFKCLIIFNSTMYPNNPSCIFPPACRGDTALTAPGTIIPAYSGDTSMNPTITGPYIPNLSTVDTGGDEGSVQSTTGILTGAFGAVLAIGLFLTLSIPFVRIRLRKHCVEAENQGENTSENHKCAMPISSATIFPPDRNTRNDDGERDDYTNGNRPSYRGADDGVIEASGTHNGVEWDKNVGFPGCDDRHATVNTVTNCRLSYGADDCAHVKKPTAKRTERDVVPAGGFHYVEPISGSARDMAKCEPYKVVALSGKFFNTADDGANNFQTTSDDFIYNTAYDSVDGGGQEKIVALAGNFFNTEDDRANNFQTTSNDFIYNTAYDSVDGAVQDNMNNCP